MESGAQASRFAGAVSSALSALDVDASGGSPAERLDALLRVLREIDPNGTSFARTLAGRLAGLALDPAAIPQGIDAARNGAFARQLLLVSSVALAGGDGASAFQGLAERFAADGSLTVRQVEAALGRVARLAASGLSGALGGGAEAWWSKVTNAAVAELGPDVARTDTPLQRGLLLRALLAANVDGEASFLASRVIDRAATMGDSLALEARVLLEATNQDPSRAALERFVGSAEFEHAWSAARREAGDPPALAFAVPDGNGHTTVRFSHERDRDEGTSESDTSFHLTIGVDFSALGPVRADAMLREGRVAIRLVAAEPETAQAIRRRATELETLLGIGGREVLLAIADGTVAEASFDGGAEESLPRAELGDALMDAWG